MTPSAYYVVSTEFDYRQYLEKRSHHDRTVLALDKTAESIIGSTDRIVENLQLSGKAITGELSSLTDSTKEGFLSVEARLEHLDESIRYGLGEISFNIQELGGQFARVGSILEAGLDQLNQTMMQSNDLLGQLVVLISTPEQVWAKEQFDYAQHCVENELWEEALEYCTKAISGDDRHPGHKLEPAFYFLRGTLYLGGRGAPVKLVNLDDAIRDFNDCAKFCGRQRIQLKQKALINVGWAKYCSGYVRDGIDVFRGALEVTEPNNPEGSFLLAKSYMHLGMLDEAEHWFKSAIHWDDLYAVRALNDADFSAHRINVVRWIETKRNEMQVALKNFVETEFDVEPLMELIDLAETNGVTFARKDEIQAETKRLISGENIPLTDLIRLNQWHLKELLNVAKKEAVRSIDELETLAKGLMHYHRFETYGTIEKPTKNSSVRDSSQGGGILWGILIGLVAAIGLVVFDTMQSESTGFWLIFSVVIGLVMFGFIFGLAGGIVGWIIGAIVGSVKDSERMAADERSSMQKKQAQDARAEAESARLFENNKRGKALQESVQEIKGSLGKWLSV